MASRPGLHRQAVSVFRSLIARLIILGRTAPRLPFVGLFLAATTGIVLGNSLDLGVGTPLLWALPSGLCLLLTLTIKSRPGFWIGVGFFFAALQSGHQIWSPGLFLLASAPVQQDETSGPATHSQGPFYFQAQVRVLATPKPWGQGWTFPAVVERGHWLGSPAPAWPVRVQVRWPGPDSQAASTGTPTSFSESPPKYGDVLSGVGSLQSIAPPRNPGEFDQARWLAGEGILAEWRVPQEAETLVLSSGNGSKLIQLALITREHAQRLLAAGIEDFPSIHALLQAMTLGETSGLTPEQLEAFRQTGTLHLFSVSGLHVGMMAVIFWFALKLLRLPFPVQILAVILLLFFYATVTGLRPASVRAAFMASVILLGWLLQRPSSPTNSLAAAGFILLLLNPPLLFHPGFQLSFLVVFSILVLGVPAVRWLQAYAGPDLFLPRTLYRWPQRIHAWAAHQFATLAAISWSAWLGSLPLIVVNYHLVSISALIVNLWAVPLAFGVLALSLLALLGGVFSVGLAAIFNHANVLLGGLLLHGVLASAEIPGGSWRTSLALRPPVEITVLDLGPGGSQILWLRGHSTLIDTGSVWAWNRTVRPFLESRGTNRLQALVLTHGDAAHLGAASLAAETYRPDFVAVGALPERSRTFRAFMDWIQTSGLPPPRRVQAGVSWSLPGPSTLSVLTPPVGWMAPRADDRALVLKWESPELRVLFLGDAGLGLQDVLLEQDELDLSADILILGRPATGEIPRKAFLERVAPRAVIVSAADFPRREQFTPLWEAALNQTNAAIFRQDQTGAVVISKSGSRVRIRGFLPPHQAIEWDVIREETRE